MLFEYWLEIIEYYNNLKRILEDMAIVEIVQYYKQKDKERREKEIKNYEKKVNKKLKNFEKIQKKLHKIKK